MPQGKLASIFCPWKHVPDIFLVCFLFPPGSILLMIFTFYIITFIFIILRFMIEKWYEFIAVLQKIFYTIFGYQRSIFLTSATAKQCNEWSGHRVFSCAPSPSSLAERTKEPPLQTLGARPPRGWPQGRFSRQSQSRQFSSRRNILRQAMQIHSIEKPPFL